ncbi:hypothetical protein PRECH8_25310 [Insulibacter thermoxylanivorax]|uniref:Uncharacterized protein n=1 Tax=Insulibacter thermoxylanivorax TaxID=2749268 RepID=A0A916QEE0_9BACL|nr:hypothetical protein PRECH8_25310 [Insulibacter thermoxylanivorax]
MKGLRKERRSFFVGWKEEGAEVKGYSQGIPQKAVRILTINHKICNKKCTIFSEYDKLLCIMYYDRKTIRRGKEAG